MLEVVANTMSGFILSWCLWVFVIAPWYDLDTTYVDNFNITVAFTVLSLVRSYFWRRLMTRVHR